MYRQGRGGAEEFDTDNFTNDPLNSTHHILMRENSKIHGHRNDCELAYIRMYRVCVFIERAGATKNNMFTIFATQSNGTNSPVES